MKNIKFKSFISDPQDNLSEKELIVKADIGYSIGTIGSLSDPRGFEVEINQVLMQDTMSGYYVNIINKLQQKDIEALKTQAIIWYTD